MIPDSPAAGCTLVATHGSALPTAKVANAAAHGAAADAAEAAANAERRMELFWNQLGRIALAV